MKEQQISRTALFTAYFRAYHALHDTPKIFEDFLASNLLTKEESTTMGQKLADGLKVFDPARAALCPDPATALAEVIHSHTGAPLILSRARYTEDTLENAVRQGVRQYVILGAGMDTFAFRRKEILDKLQIFEIDHPAMQAFKRRRLNELSWEQPDQLHFIPVDFTQDSLATALTSSPYYDPQAVSFFSWLGVTYYLPSDSVFNTLRALADIAPVGSTIIFDYYHTDVFIPEKTSKSLQLGMEYLRQIGEPIITGFDSSTLAPDLARLGLGLHENLSPTNIEERYFQKRTDGYHASEHVHFAQAVVK
ncbi:hypothetical protein SPSIL_044190 [Sporomusa silvacetica DSM 10669]|uniref:S-adenosyl-L-methionine-dependent methyltransferase n=1 Tax=Sporomusa silvacetica DSM 10669 TaxID=1123289 RepID=A0ABZ3IR68_9FIRM|nr:class I SAM-dependent methyltransferase [Sporomusa silvacetica]OZC20680.1 putative S-adenosyl-L-methionine-dependent methyltransferase [Sporomusa silvacetica DSM 10669]